MNRLFTPSIRRSISFTFLVVTVLVLVMAAVSYLQLRQVQPYSEIIIQNSANLAELQSLAAATAALDADLERYLVIQGAEYKESVEEDLQEMENALAKLQSTAVNDDQQAIAEMESLISQLQTGVENVIRLQESDASSGEITRSIVAIYSDIDRLQEIQENLSEQTIATIQSTAETQSAIASNVVTQSVILGIIVVGITIVATVTTDRRLRVIVSLTNTTTAIAEGDLSQVAPVESNDEIGTLATSFNTMTNQLRETLAGLEQRIADRTQALETSTEVGRRISTILDQRELVREVVEQVQTAFHYYHAQIYLFDNEKETLTMVGGTGNAGQTMLEQGHFLPKGRGLVGRAADTNLPILVSNVERSIGHEIINAETVEEVFERESNLESTKTWYAKRISASFTDIQDFTERVAQMKASGGQVPRLGYILYGLTDFMEMIKTGAEEAAQSLGIDVEIASADFDTEKGIHLFREMIADKKDGLVVSPLFPEKWVAPIEEAVRLGIPVLTANLRCPGAPVSATFVQNSYQSGRILARELQKTLTAAGKTSGEIVVASDREIHELQERYAGLKQGLQDSAYTLSELYDVPLDDEQQNLTGWEQLVEENPDMVAAVGLASVDLPSLIRIKKRTNASWIAAGYDITVEILEGIRDGTAQVTIGQHPYLQGYLPVLALGEHLVDGTALAGWIVDSWQSNPLLPETRAEIVVPITIGDNVLGVLDVQDNHSGGLNEDDVELLQSIANQVAAALQNARAYQHTQQQVTRETLMANINQQIQSTTDVEEALQVAVRELGRALGTKTSVSLQKAESGNGQEGSA
jgi:simple sugar transport system substrate-binding protein